MNASHDTEFLSEIPAGEVVLRFFHDDQIMYITGEAKDTRANAREMARLLRKAADYLEHPPTDAYGYYAEK